MLIQATTAICDSCNTTHDAELRVREGRVLGLMACPRGEVEHHISSDAEMFMALRGRSGTDLQQPPPEGLLHLLNYVSITNACNFACTVCGTNAASPADASYLSVEEICRRVEAARSTSGRVMHLFGGEPTLHPDLYEIVERLAAMGFSVGIVSNGVLFGRKPQLARELKARGLGRVCLQFDSFSSEALQLLGRDKLHDKRQALRNILAAGVDLGLNCTVTCHNLPEIPELLAHGLEAGHGVRNMTFGTAAPVGRFDIPRDESVDREQVIGRMLEVGQRFHFSLDDVMPLPAYLPWGMQVHPECGVHLVFVRTPSGARPLNRFVDLARMYHCLGRNRMRPHPISKYIVPAFHLLAAGRPGRARETLALVGGLLSRRRDYSLVNVGISDYRAAAFLDAERIARCASAFHTSAGPVEGCLHFYRGASHPGSREYEVQHGGF